MARGDQDGMSGFIGAIEEYMNLTQERNRLMGNLFVNQVKQGQNKIASAERTQRLQDQSQLPEVTEQTDPFSEQPVPQVREGAAGSQLHYPNPREFTLMRIQQKKQRGFSLSEKEQEFERKYFGLPTEKEKKKQSFLRKVPPKAIMQSRSFLGIDQLAPDARLTLDNALLKNSEDWTPEEATLVAMQNIKTQEDLDELVDRRDEFAAEGINVQYILDYFTGKLK